MSYAIIGFGKIGHALAKAFARKDIEVSVAITATPEALAAAGRPRSDPQSSPKRCGKPSRRTHLLGGPLRGASRGREGPADLEGQTVIDVTNALRRSP